MTARYVYVPEWTIGDRLRNVRRHAGLSQRDFAHKLDVNEVTYSSWEADRHRMSDERLLEIAIKIKKLTGVPTTWFGVVEPHPRARRRRRRKELMAVT